MTCSLSACRLCFALLLGVALLAGQVLADGPDDKKSPPAKKPAVKDTKTDAKEGDKPKGDDKTKEGEDKPKEEPKTIQQRLEVPTEGGVEALEKFLKEVETIRPKTQAEMIALMTTAPKAMETAAKKILELEKDEKAPAHKLAKFTLLRIKVSQLTRMPKEQQKAVYTEILAQVKESGLTAKEMPLISAVASGLEHGGNAELAAEAYETFGKLGSESKDERVQQAVKRMVGAARRMKLLGKEIEIKGQTVSGDKFDWAAYRGKVVLVDFWATWCGPCRAELPNVKKNYELYHAKGFDVVGISIDQNEEALHEFLKKEELPWTTLFEKSAGWNNSIASYYGVSGIPCVLLVDKEGKVISLNARGPELGKLLAAQLGPAEEPKDKPESTKDENKKDAKKDAEKK